MIDIFYQIRNIATYNSTYDVIDAYFPDVVGEMDREHLDVLRNFDDFESHAFCVINDGYVMVYDSISGDVYGRFDSLESFRDTVLREVEEEIA